MASELQFFSHVTSTEERQNILWAQYLFLVVWCNRLVARGWFLVKNQSRILSPWRTEYKCSWLSAKAVSYIRILVWTGEEPIFFKSLLHNLKIEWYNIVAYDLFLHTETHFEPQFDEGQFLFFIKIHFPIHKCPICTRLVRHSKLACKIYSF